MGKGFLAISSLARHLLTVPDISFFSGIMPTNTKGYITAYYHRERGKIIDELKKRGDWCGHDEDLEIHHKKHLNGDRPGGQLARLAEWKKNKDNLKALCHECHCKEHKRNDWWKH